jgi:Arylsulfotransferase (ASST)
MQQRNEPKSDPFDAVGRVEADETGVRTWDKTHTMPGYVIFHTVVDNKIVVIDLDGTVVMEFRATPPDYWLYRPGKFGDRRNIYCILVSNDDRTSRSIAALNEDGSVIWKTPHFHFTHDFHIRHNRRIVSVLRDDRKLQGQRLSDNVICDMDIQGKVRWRWSMLDHLQDFSIGPEVRDGIATFRNDNPFHVNSVQIGDYDVVAKKVGEPAIVASARNLNTVFLVGEFSNDLLFEYSGGTMGPHHARVLPGSYPSAGNLLIFDNGYSFLPPNQGDTRGYSRVIEVTIPHGDIVWEYRAEHDDPPFYSPIVGGQQRFPNGNTLITEGYYGRIFEVDYAGRIVWDYVYPEFVPIADHLTDHLLHETGLRQVYRAYKVSYDWIE